MATPPVEIRLTNGLIATVDAADRALVEAHEWRALRRGHTHYAVFGRAEGKRCRVTLMHRLIMGVTDPDIHVDHRDGNGLNNCRANLRNCSRAENLHNARRRSDNTTGFKGVGYNPRLNRFHARISIHNKVKYLGSFATAEEAHRAYCSAAQAAFGEFARVR